MSKFFKFLRRMLLSFLIFIISALPFKGMAFLIPGVTEIRPENVVPPVMGILFGVPGALGAALGNIAGDLINGTSVYTFCFGFLSNFLYAWIAHKMWYTWFEKDGKIKYPQLVDFHSILKLIVILFVDCIFIALMISLLSEAIGMSRAVDAFLILFFNNFDFAIVLGIPILSLVGNYYKGYEVPRKRELSPMERQLDRFYSTIPWAVLTIGIGYFAVSLADRGALNPQAAAYAMYMVMLLLLVYALRPRTAEIVESRRSTFGSSIKVRTATVFLTIGFLIVAFSLLLAYVLSKKNPAIDRLERWTDIFSVTGFAINFVFAIILIFLRFIERNVTDPIEKLSSIVERFGNHDHLDHEGNERLRAECDTINSRDEIAALAGGLGTMIGSVEHYAENLKAATAESERINTELSLAKAIQAGSLPDKFPPFPEHTQFDIYALMQPAKEVGGDFYDFFLIDDDHLGLVIADVSGKGIGAALFMMNCKALIRSRASISSSPGEILTDVNRQICDNNPVDMFVTVWLGILQISTGLLQAANAGHEFPAIRRAGGAFELLKDKHGFVVGGMEGVRYRNYELSLEPGDFLFVYTDGVPEATDEKNELFGTDRMLEALNAGAATDCEGLIRDVLNKIEVFVGTAPQFDDTTMLCVRYNGQSA